MPDELSPLRRMWHASFKLGAIILVACLLYSLLYFEELSVLSLSQAIGAAAAFMIGISYAMSGVGYFFDFLDDKVAYRKYFGLVGLLLAIVYTYTLFFADPGTYFFNLFETLGTPQAILGILAMGILLGMVIISTPEGIRAIGPQNWRLGLRAGYVASALFVTRAAIIYSNDWTVWWRHGDWYMPPLTLIITVFTIGVILFRGSIFVSQMLKKIRIKEGGLTQKYSTSHTPNTDADQT